MALAAKASVKASCFRPSPRRRAWRRSLQARPSAASPRWRLLGDLEAIIKEARDGIDDDATSGDVHLLDDLFDCRNQHVAPCLGFAHDIDIGAAGCQHICDDTKLLAAGGLHAQADQVVNI